MSLKRIYEVSQLEELLKEYSSGNSNVNVAYGLRPSGVVHLGNLFTLALAGEIVNKIGPHVSQLVLTVLDIEIPFTGDWDFVKNKYVRHYKDLPCEEGHSYADRSRIELYAAMESLNEDMKVPYLLRNLSEIQKEPSFRESLKRVLEHEESQQLIQEKNNGRVEVFPLCPDCGTSYTNCIRGKVNRYDNETISTFCTNPECDVKDYKVNILDTSADLSIHPLMGALRDVVEPVVNLHVYGGDYSFPHGESREPKIRKIQRMMDIAAPELDLNFFVGPTIFAKGREKMSKSANNGVNRRNLKKLFGDDYMKNVLDFTREMMEKDYFLVDFAVVQERILR